MSLLGFVKNNRPHITKLISRANKIVNIKLFDSINVMTECTTTPNKPWSKSVKDYHLNHPTTTVHPIPPLEVLCVSQFTLYALTSKGSKPDFHRAMKPTLAKEMYDRFLQLVETKLNDENHHEQKEEEEEGEQRRRKVMDGRFGEMMQVSLVNDGPVTIILDSKNK